MLNLEIDVSAIIYNIDVIRKKTRAEVCAVIKANCYGLGLSLAKYIESYVDSFSVSSVGEAKEVRALGITKRIYILGAINPHEFELLENVIYTICSEADVDFLDKIDTDFEVALKINTGMNRLGVKSVDYKQTIRKVLKTKKLHLDSIFTHFFDVDNGSHIRQFDLFEKMTSGLSVKRHCCASNCLKIDKRFHLDMVRCGLAIYGYGHCELIPSLSAYTTIAQINHLKKGEFLGYGNFCVDFDAKIAIIRAGYADGYRKLRKEHYASINGKLVSVMGQISMDMTAVDVSGLDVLKNDKVFLIDNNASAEHLAEARDTIVYEVLTAFNGSRVSRLYKNIPSQNT